MKMLQTKAIRYQEFEDGRQRIQEVDWRKDSREAGPKLFWTGFIEFRLKKNVSDTDAKVLEILASGKGSDEVKEADIRPEDWPLWRVADGEEWTKVEASGAARTLDLEESAEVERQLKESGKANRILPSTVVRRWKPSELPGEPPTMKSRWRIDKDPDLLSLDRYSPTVTTAIISVVLQTAASLKFRCAIGDLKNAFMQSLPLMRPQGRLFWQTAARRTSWSSPRTFHRDPCRSIWAWRCTSSLAKVIAESLDEFGIQAIQHGSMYFQTFRRRKAERLDCGGSG